jgi:hypothetical protein
MPLLVLLHTKNSRAITAGAWLVQGRIVQAVRNIASKSLPVIRRTDRDFEFASVSRELIEKFSKRTRLIEQLARERYTVLEAEARDLVRKTGMDFADAFAQVKGKLGAESREAKSVAPLAPEAPAPPWVGSDFP